MYYLTPTKFLSTEYKNVEINRVLDKVSPYMKRNDGKNKLYNIFRQTHFNT